MSLRPTPRQLALLVSIAGLGASLGDPAQARSVDRGSADPGLSVALGLPDARPQGSEPEAAAAAAALLVHGREQSLPPFEFAASGEDRGDDAQPATPVAAAAIAAASCDGSTGRLDDSTVGPLPPPAAASSGDTVAEVASAPLVHCGTRPPPHDPTRHQVVAGLRVRQPKGPSASGRPWESVRAAGGDDPRRPPVPSSREQEEGTPGQADAAAALPPIDEEELAAVAVEAGAASPVEKVKAYLELHNLKRAAPSPAASAHWQLADVAVDIEIPIGAAVAAEAQAGSGTAPAAAPLPLPLRLPLFGTGPAGGVDLELDFFCDPACGSEAGLGPQPWPDAQDLLSAPATIGIAPTPPASDSSEATMLPDRPGAQGRGLSSATSASAAPSASIIERAYERAALAEHAVRLSRPQEGSSFTAAARSRGFDLDLNLDLPDLGLDPATRQRLGTHPDRLQEPSGQPTPGQPSPVAGLDAPDALRSDEGEPVPALSRPLQPLPQSVGDGALPASKAELPPPAAAPTASGMQDDGGLRLTDVGQAGSVLLSSPLRDTVGRQCRGEEGGSGFMVGTAVAALAPSLPAPSGPVSSEMPTEPAHATARQPARQEGSGLPIAESPSQAAPIPSQAAAPVPPAGSSFPLGETLALSESRLDEVRGGFQTDGGLQISFGIDRAVYINGSLVPTTSLNVVGGTDPAAGAALATITGPASNMTLVQNGTGNTFMTGPISAANLGTVIQNTLDNQKIQSVTSINATVNSLQIMQSRALESSLRGAIIDSLRR